MNRVPKIVSWRLHFREKYCSTVNKNGRNKPDFFFGGFEENGLSSKALIKSSFPQIWQPLVSGFWFQGVPTRGFQQKPGTGFLCPGTVGSLHPQVGPGHWQCPGSVHRTLRVCIPCINRVAELCHPLTWSKQTGIYIWGSCDGSIPLSKNIMRDTRLEWHMS